MGKMSDEDKSSHHHHHPHHRHHHHHHHEEEEKQQGPPTPAPPPQYGTFQGVANYPPQPVSGFPQPIPPPGASDSPSQYYSHGYQAVPGYAVPEGSSVRERRLPCCGCGIGWFLFIIGFFLAGIPWYVAAFILLFAKIDPREKPAYVISTIAAILATIALVLGLTKRHW